VIPWFLVMGGFLGLSMPGPDPEIRLLPASPSATPSMVDSSVFRPEAELHLPGYPRLALYRTGSDDVLTLRLAVPLEEGPEEAGAGQLLRQLAQNRMDVLASRVGAQVRVTRHGTSLVYEVTGATADLDFLAWILREGLQAPDAGRFEEVRRAALADVARRLETPQGVLALQVREALAPGSPPPQGTLVALERMDAARLSSVWARSHRLDAAHLVVVANLPVEAIMASLTDLGLPEAGPDPVLPPSPPSGEARGRPEVIRLWLAEAWPIAEGRDPRAMVAVRLLTETIQARPGDYELGVELWEVGRRWALVLSGAAYPRDQQAMRARLQGLLQETLAGITDEGVRLHSAEVRREFLDAARTPWGLAELVGQAIDVGESTDEVERFVEALARMEAADLRRFLEALAAETPVRQEVRP
jgi:predicted Zn-dependent peptidase